LFYGKSGGGTKTFENNLEFSKADSSVFMGWGANVNKEKLMADAKTIADARNKAIQDGDRETMVEIEQKFKHELKQIADFEEGRRLLMTKSQFFNENAGYKQAYYQMKFGVDSEDYNQFLSNIKDFYVEGLVWNYAYYYKGCISWEWSYPYYYAPFASDLTYIKKVNEFNPGAPFQPFQQ
jgi:5'-3' exoribonuclease 2